MDNLHSYLPIEWSFGDEPSDGRGGDAPSDAGTIYIVNQDECSDDYERLEHETTISEMIDYVIDGHICGPSGKIEGAESIEIMRKIQKALRVEIAKIDDYIDA